MASQSDARGSNKKGTEIIAQPTKYAKLTESINRFALNLTQLIGIHQTKNVVFSPLGISQGLSTIMAGSNGRTLEELMHVLRFRERYLGPEKVHEDFETLSGEYVEKQNDKIRGIMPLWLFNMAVISEEIKVFENFSKIAEKSYKSILKRVNFCETKSVTDMINKYVAEKTLEYIPNIVNNLDSQTKLLLVNVVYFSGEWDFKFTETRTSYFTNSDKTITNVKSMHTIGAFSYYENKDIQAIKLRYLGNGSMVILLPQPGLGVDELIKKLDKDLLDTDLDKMKMQLIDLNLPKFKIEGANIDLRRPIYEMGGQSIFINWLSDFSGISHTPSFFIDQFIHRSFLMINEYGATGTQTSKIDKMGREKRIADKKVMAINRPFVFFVRDNLNDVILFMGVIRKIN